MYWILSNARTLPYEEAGTSTAPFWRALKSCNAVELDRHIVLPEGAPNLVATLENRGYRSHELPMSEFLKAGGACKCLTMFCRNEKQWSDRVVE
jgi:hypothetical protein